MEAQRVSFVGSTRERTPVLTPCVAYGTYTLYRMIWQGSGETKATEPTGGREEGEFAIV